jgi:hypothetical protein
LRDFHAVSLQHIRCYTGCHNAPKSVTGKQSYAALEGGLLTTLIVAQYQSMVQASMAATWLGRKPQHRTAD